MWPHVQLQGAVAALSSSPTSARNSCGKLLDLFWRWRCEAVNDLMSCNGGGTITTKDARINQLGELRSMDAGMGTWVVCTWGTEAELLSQGQAPSVILPSASALPADLADLPGTAPTLLGSGSDDCHLLFPAQD